MSEKQGPALEVGNKRTASDVTAELISFRKRFGDWPGIVSGDLSLLVSAAAAALADRETIWRLREAINEWAEADSDPMASDDVRALERVERRHYLAVHALRREYTGELQRVRDVTNTLPVVTGEKGVNDVLLGV